MLNNFYIGFSEIPEHELDLALACERKTRTDYKYVVLDSSSYGCTLNRCYTEVSVSDSTTVKGTLDDFRTWMNTVYPGWNATDVCYHPNAVISYVKEPSCQCQNLLAGHDEWCAYHKQDYEDPRTRTDLWGIKRQEVKTRAEINEEHMSLTDKYGSKKGGLLRYYGAKP